MVFKTSKALFIAALFSVSTGLTAGAIHISSVKQHKMLCDGSKPVVTMYTASWCGPCKRTKPHFNAIASKYKDVVLCMVDIDNQSLSSLHRGIKSVPTFIFSHGGKTKKRKSGSMSRVKLQGEIDRFVASLS